MFQYMILNLDKDKFKEEEVERKLQRKKLLKGSFVAEIPKGAVIKWLKLKELSLRSLSKKIPNKLKKKIFLLYKGKIYRLSHKIPAEMQVKQVFVF